jgi:hypothetical protein
VLRSCSAEVKKKCCGAAAHPGGVRLRLRLRGGKRKEVGGERQKAIDRQ